MRFALLLAAAIVIAGCSGANQDRQAVHQGILDHLSEAGFSNQNMDISETSIQFNGDKADALVQISPKGAKAQGMQMHYALQRSGSQWKVVGRSDSGAGHGTTAPGATNPHGGAMPVGAMPGQMPSPDDLPPSGKKK